MARLRSIRRARHRWRQLTPAQRGLMVEAALLLLGARLALAAIPFPRLARRFGRFTPPGHAQDGDDGDRAGIARDIGWAVTRAAAWLPFRAVCLPQAMAARMMLSRRGVRSVLHFGAARQDGGPLDTHAWLDAAGVEVTGYPVARRFTEIGCFV